MIYIVTGGINSGKTTKLLSLYREIKTGDGFILPKLYIGDSYAGQQIVRLSTGEGRPFSLKKDFIPAFWNEQYRYDNYSFCREGFDFAFASICHIVDAGLSPIFIDEIGPLELEEKGFYCLLSKLLEHNDTLYISVRELLIAQVISKFSINNYTMLRA